MYLEKAISGEENGDAIVSFPRLACGVETSTVFTSVMANRNICDRTLRDRQIALAELVHAVREYPRIAESKPLTLQGSEHPQAVHELNKAVDRAEGLLITNLSLGKMPLR